VSPFVWLDGRVLPAARALVPALDPAFLRGLGCFETLRTAGGAPFRLPDHLDRMRATAKRFGFPCSPPDLDPVIRGLCRRNRLRDARVRITLSGAGRLLVTADPIRPLPRAWFRNGAELMIAPWRRDGRAPLSGHKTLSYAEHVVAHEEALERGCADAVLVGLRGELLEGACSTIFLVRDGRLVTPALAQGILPGVTRKVVMELESVRERRLKLAELWKAEEAFITGSVMGIVPVLKPPGPLTRRLMNAYRGLLNAAGGAGPRGAARPARR
jgi:branched-chain amino acid aminotransferase